MSSERTEIVPPDQFVVDLHRIFGDNHSRATHAKGILAIGTFTPDKKAAALTKAFHLQEQPSNVLVRLSDNTGIPGVADTRTETNPRGLAIRFTMPDGRFTDIVCHSFNGFPAATPDEFHGLLTATWTSKGDVPKPTPLDLYYETHPRAKIFSNICHLPSSYARLIFYGVNAFEFTNQKGDTHFVRYQFQPAEGVQNLTDEQAAAAGPNYLFEEIHQRLAARPVRYQYFAQLSGEGDKIDDPSLAWPDSRPQVLLGELEIREIVEFTPEQHQALSFLPTNLPEGITPADPMIEFRGRVYPFSVKDRQ
ncbi:MAG TPA: catalase family peroxidase [Puia sp.]